MRDWENEGAVHAALQKRVVDKIKTQSAVLKTTNGHAEGTGARQVLSEMRQNKTTVDFNRAMFDYEEADKGKNLKLLRSI